MLTLRQALISLSLAALAAPAAAQFSDSWNFLKAVRERNGVKANELLGKNNPNLIDTPDRTTGERGLHIAVRGRDLGWVGFLLGKGARIDLKDNAGNTPLMAAAQIGNIDAARLLLGRGASVNAVNGVGETPLILAVQRRDLAMVRLLLSQGADVSRRDTASGMTAREYAARDGRSEAIIKAIDETKAAPKRGVAGPK